MEARTVSLRVKLTPEEMEHLEGMQRVRGFNTIDETIGDWIIMDRDSPF
jgi:hypothetical protein